MASFAGVSTQISVRGLLSAPACAACSSSVGSVCATRVSRRCWQCVPSTSSSAIGEIGSAPPLAVPFADNVSAAAVFGNPSARFGTPLSTTGLLAGRTIDLCNPNDPICSATGDSREAHDGYQFPPFNEEAAGFVAGRV